MENRGSADNVDDVAKDSSRAGGIQESDFAEEFSSDLPSTAMLSSAPSGSSPYASLSSPSAAKVDDRDVAHGAGRVGDTKKLEHAPPTDPRMQLPAAGFGMVDSMGRPPVVYASNSDVGPGAFPVRSGRNTATRRTVRSPIRSYDSPREFTNEESKQDDGVRNSAVAGIGVYAVEAQRVPDGSEDGTVLVAEAQYVRTKWYQRRWIFVGLALLACGFAAAVVVMVVLLVRQPSAAASSSLTPPPTVQTTGAPSIPELTASPVPTPTVSPTRDEDSIEEILSIRFGNSSTDQQSPQSKARAWMKNNDTWVLNADISATMEIEERYILVVLYFAMQGSAWFNQSDFLSSKHHCLWNTSAPAAGFLGITCDALKQVIRLDLMRNGLNGTIPSEIRFLTKLEGLNLTGNNISGNLPSSLDQLTKLQGVDCSHNNLFGTIPPELFQISTLQVVKLGNNSLNGTLPDFDDKKGNVSDVFANNSLAGTPSEGLGNRNKSRSGTIPKSIGSHKALVTLILDNNELKGSLPSSLGSLSKMEVFSANNNELSGTIPTEMGRLTNLTRLELMSNELYGEIPSELGLLGELKILNLADNKFNGTVPTQLGDLSRLQTVHLENNSLGGDMESFCKNKASFLGADCDGEITCTCCTYCCNASDVCTNLSPA
ncbi:hypothetical protein MHU86_18255 [Fragilaria crotonensis]|nr:hypothetical protein MHU86_18255 [Fragilaria crotonensis]